MTDRFKNALKFSLAAHKEFTFGVGANMKYYGPLKHNENNIAAFLQVALF